MYSTVVASSPHAAPVLYEITTRNCARRTRTQLPQHRVLCCESVTGVLRYFISVAGDSVVLLVGSAPQGGAAVACAVPHRRHRAGARHVSHHALPQRRVRRAPRHLPQQVPQRPGLHLWLRRRAAGRYHTRGRQPGDGHPCGPCGAQGCQVRTAMHAVRCTAYHRSRCVQRFSAGGLFCLFWVLGRSRGMDSISKSSPRPSVSTSVEEIDVLV